MPKTLTAVLVAGTGTIRGKDENGPYVAQDRSTNVSGYENAG